MCGLLDTVGDLDLLLADSLVVVVAVQDAVIWGHLHLSLFEARLNHIEIGSETWRRGWETKVGTRLNLNWWHLYGNLGKLYSVLAHALEKLSHRMGRDLWEVWSRLHHLSMHRRVLCHHMHRMEQWTPCIGNLGHFSLLHWWTLRDLREDTGYVDADVGGLSDGLVLRARCLWHLGKLFLLCDNNVWLVLWRLRDSGYLLDGR